MAASATFALKAGVWFRRARLLMVSPDSRAHRARRQAETPLSALCRFPEPALSMRRNNNAKAHQANASAQDYGYSKANTIVQIFSELKSVFTLAPHDHGVGCQVFASP